MKAGNWFVAASLAVAIVAGPALAKGASSPASRRTRPLEPRPGSLRNAKMNDSANRSGVRPVRPHRSQPRPDESLQLG